MVFDFQLFWHSVIRRKAHISLISLGVILAIFLYYLIMLIFIYGSLQQNIRKIIMISYFILAFSIFLPGLFVSPKSYIFGDPKVKFYQKKNHEENICGNLFMYILIFAIMIIFFVLIIFFTVYNTGIQLTQPTNATTSLKLMTFNINSGFNTNGDRVYFEILETIKESNADIIALQECDTAKFTNDFDDIVRFISNDLKYFSYYGPSPSNLTF
jgi:hypothetical protein